MNCYIRRQDGAEDMVKENSIVSDDIISGVARPPC